MNKEFKNFSRVIILIAIAIAAYALSSCKRSTYRVDIEKEYGTYTMGIYPFEHNGHSYLYFETCSTVDIEHDPDCKKCKMQ